MWRGTKSSVIDEVVSDLISGLGVDGSLRRVALASHCLMSKRMTYKRILHQPAVAQPQNAIVPQ